MAETEKTKIDEQPVDDKNTDYIAALAELREKSVPKEQYAELKAENARLLKSLINGETIEGQTEQPGADVAELRKQLFSGETELTNLDYVTHALALRDALIADGKPDPFLPYGEKITPTNEDIEAAERVAKVLQECVDYADGDSAIFTSELQRVMIDTGPKKPTKK